MTANVGWHKPIIGHYPRNLVEYPERCRALCTDMGTTPQEFIRKTIEGYDNIAFERGLVFTGEDVVGSEFVRHYDTERTAKRWGLQRCEFGETLVAYWMERETADEYAQRHGWRFAEERQDEKGQAVLVYERR